MAQAKSDIHAFFNKPFRLFKVKNLIVADRQSNLLPIFKEQGNFKEKNPKHVGSYFTFNQSHLYFIKAQKMRRSIS